MILRIFWKTRIFNIAICVALITYPFSILGETTNDNDISEFLLKIVKDIINLKNSLSYVQRRVDNTTSSLERQHSDTAAQFRGHIDTLDSQHALRLGELSNRLDKSWENTSAEIVIGNERVNVLERRITNISAENRLDKGSLNATLMTFFTRLFEVGLSPILSQLSQLRTMVDRIRSSFKMVSYNRSALLRQKNQLFIPDVEEHLEQIYNITAAAPELRLVGGSNATKGRLEVLYKGRWGLVCDDGFDDTDATVACRQLGYGSGSVLSRSAFFRRLWEGIDPPETSQSTPIWMANLSCTGSELYLSQCQHQGWNVTVGCSLADDVAIKCQSTITVRAMLTGRTTAKPAAAATRAATGQALWTTEGQITDAAVSNSMVELWSLRLSQMEKKRGVVEIFHDGFWGAVCLTGFTEDYDATAAVACRQLNFSTGYTQSYYGEEVSRYVLQDVNCYGNESTLIECSRSSIAHDCNNGEPLVAQCMEATEDRMIGIRLLEGHDNSSGYVQLRVNGSWGFLCGRSHLVVSGWDISDAEVLCRQLGMIRSRPRIMSSGRRTLSSLSEVNFVPDSFNCEGTEPTLWDCPRVLVPAYQSACGNPSHNAVYLHCEAQKYLSPLLI